MEEHATFRQHRLGHTAADFVGQPFVAAFVPLVPLVPLVLWQFSTNRPWGRPLGVRKMTGVIDSKGEVAEHRGHEGHGVISGHDMTHQSQPRPPAYRSGTGGFTVAESATVVKWTNRTGSPSHNGASKAATQNFERIGSFN